MAGQLKVNNRTRRSSRRFIPGPMCEECPQPGNMSSAAWCSKSKRGPLSNTGVPAFRLWTVETLLTVWRAGVVMDRTDTRSLGP